MAAPKARRNTTIIAALLYFITIPFMILVLIGNTHKNAVLSDIYFFKLDVAQIIPIAVGNANLLNSVARSLGLHDFYQVGVWNFCEGYNDEYAQPSQSFFLRTKSASDSSRTIANVLTYSHQRSYPLLTTEDLLLVQPR